MLSIWNPFTPVLSNTGKSDKEMSVRDYFDRVFDTAWQDTFRNLNTNLSGIEYIAEKDKIIVNIDIPGVKESDISVSALDNVVSVKAERKTTNQSVKIEKSFSIPVESNYDTLDAHLIDGVLTISIELKPKTEKAVKKIEVKPHKQAQQII